ncbi:trophoblast glycoprotein [Planococcus citri]|uniref:trophoblast glycoprotein n=1 Tax=Planococcus citri TaxID=170843 RepID=UPI0031F9EA10
MLFASSSYNVCITMLYFFLVFSLLPSIYGDLCSVCKCGIKQYYDQNMYVTDCTNAGIDARTVELLENLPTETEVFIFKGNFVPVLPVNIFGSDKNLTKLKVIDMTDNGIEVIKGKTFHHVPVVERLILDHNSITLTNNSHPRVFSNFENLRELHLTDAFLDNTSADLAEELHSIFINSNLTKLIKLHLEQNEISSFADKRVFCDLQNLMDLHLGNNQLKNVNFDLKCLQNLRYLDLQYNQISHFSREDLNTFDSFAKKREFNLDIHKNNFTCDCSVNDLYSWLKTTKVIVRNNESISCHYFRDPHPILLKDFNSSKCINRIPYEGAHPYTKYLFFSILVFLVIYLIFLSVKYTTLYCRHSIAPTGKVHYVVITNQDDHSREVRVQLNKIPFSV